MPAKRIIVLDQLAPARYRYAMWADVPLARQPFYARPIERDKDGVPLPVQSNPSVWLGADAAEQQAIRDGAVVERIEQISAPGRTIPQILAELAARWLAFQDEISAENPWNRYGSVYTDQDEWIAGGVA